MKTSNRNYTGKKSCYLLSRTKLKQSGWAQRTTARLWEGSGTPGRHAVPQGHTEGLTSLSQMLLSRHTSSETRGAPGRRCRSPQWCCNSISRPRAELHGAVRGSAAALPDCKAEGGLLCPLASQAPAPGRSAAGFSLCNGPLWKQIMAGKSYGFWSLVNFQHPKCSAGRRSSACCVLCCVGKHLFLSALSL